MPVNDPSTATIFDIERFAVHDGPGIRTTVFLKGCPLRCVWCHNPESGASHGELLFTPEKCIDCHKCEDVCQQNVHQWVERRRVLAREPCVACGNCATVCYAGALEVAGREMTVEQVMELVLRDEPFYRRSRGGLTVSGGEPTMQAAFVDALLKQAQLRNIHTAVDTSGQCPWSALEMLSHHTALFLFDLKHMDGDRHTALTGESNQQILDNLRRLDTTGREIWIRIPLIPGMNDDHPNYVALARFVASLTNVTKVEILLYHRLAETKYPRLGRKFGCEGMEPPGEELAESRRRTLLEYGVSNVVWR